jgi:pyruvate kinase
MTRKAKIIATIGPASSSREAIRALVDAGMEIARLNFSHGTQEDHASVIKTIRSLEDELNRPITILQDLRGPKIRTGVLPDGKTIDLQTNDTLILSTKLEDANPQRIFVDFPGFPENVERGHRILLDDGRIELRVKKVSKDDVEVDIVIGGTLGSRKGINLPDVELTVPALTEKDHLDLEFGLEQGIDVIALSFVQRADDINQLRDLIIRYDPEKSRVPIIAKLETPTAIENLDQILLASDGVMVARGDLGVEVSPERVPSIQKSIIHKTFQTQRFVITATQMLESMVRNQRPTRAEASDVANAVFDGSDALMLSGETAIGKYPTKSVETMARIILDAECHAREWGYKSVKGTEVLIDDALAATHAACTLANDRKVAAIAVFTFSGRSAFLISKTRPDTPILAFTPQHETYRRLPLMWGVIPYLVPVVSSVERMIESVQKACLNTDFVNSGDQVVLLASFPVGAMNPPNFTMLHTLK